MAPFPSPTSNYHDNTYPSISPSRSELSARGKNVVITGGGTGIGAETARAFAEAGASRIALLGRREQPLLDTKANLEKNFPGVEVFVASTDVGKKSEVDASFKKFADGKEIHVLVSNAAVTGPIATVQDIDPDDFLSAMNTNIRGSLLVAQAFARYAAKDAVVIDINSAAAHFNLGPKFAPYNTAKLAVFRLWDSFAVEYPEMSIYHTQPGVVDTAMSRKAGGVEALGFEDHVSLPASFNVWLASPEARFLKGKFLWSNWDVNELKAQAKEIEDSPQLSIGLVGWPFKDVGWKTPWDEQKLSSIVN